VVRPTGLLGAVRLAPAGPPFGRYPSFVAVTHSLPCRSLLQVIFGAPDWIRTSDPWLRRPILYPAELRAHRLGWRYYSPSARPVQPCPPDGLGKQRRTHLLPGAAPAGHVAEWLVVCGGGRCGKQLEHSRPIPRGDGLAGESRKSLGQLTVECAGHAPQIGCPRANGEGIRRP
jgi:hypothetical protein